MKSRFNALINEPQRRIKFLFKIAKLYFYKIIDKRFPQEWQDTSPIFVFFPVACGL